MFTSAQYRRDCEEMFAAIFERLERERDEIATVEEIVACQDEEEQEPPAGEIPCKPLPFLDLPVKVRLLIYEENFTDDPVVLGKAPPLSKSGKETNSRNACPMTTTFLEPSILKVSKRVREEAHAVWLKEKTYLIRDCERRESALKKMGQRFRSSIKHVVIGEGQAGQAGSPVQRLIYNQLRYCTKLQSLAIKVPETENVMGFVSTFGNPKKLSLCTAGLPVTIVTLVVDTQSQDGNSKKLADGILKRTKENEEMQETKYDFLDYRISMLSTKAVVRIETVMDEQARQAIKIFPGWTMDNVDCGVGKRWDMKWVGLAQDT